MRIIKPARPVGNGNKMPAKIPTRPRWLNDWINSQGKVVQLSCKCIIDINLPDCTSILTGKKVEVYCDRHNKFATIEKKISIANRLAMRNIDVQNELPENPPY